MSLPREITLNQEIVARLLIASRIAPAIRKELDRVRVLVGVSATALLYRDVHNVDALLELVDILHGKQDGNLVVDALDDALVLYLDGKDDVLYLLEFGHYAYKDPLQVLAGDTLLQQWQMQGGIDVR